MITSDGAQNTFCRRRIIDQLGGRANWTPHQFAAAIGANTVHGDGAIGTESALERAHHRLARRWRKILVATFAIGTQLKHETPPR